MWVFPLGAAVVSAIFSLSLLGAWRHARRPNLLAWSAALGMFAAASFAATAGMLVGWTTAWYRIYYLFGAILNVPVLAVGTIYLLAPRRVAHACLAVVAVATLAATVAVVETEIRPEGLTVAEIPPGSAVMAPAIRNVSRYYSFAGFAVVVGGALWSAFRQLRMREQRLKELAIANLLIAGGTVIVTLGSIFARRGQGVPFSLGLFLGVSVMFLGFMRTRSKRARPAPAGSKAAV